MTPEPPEVRFFRFFRRSFHRGGGIFLLLLFFGLLLHGPARAGIPSGSRSGEAGDEAGAGFWKAHQDFFRQGEWAKGQAELERLYQWKLDRGIRNHDAYARALIRESLSQRDPDLAADLLLYAEKMAPDFSGVAWARARWHLERRPFGAESALKALQEGWQGAVLSFTRPEEAARLYAGLSFFIPLSLLLTLALFAAFQLALYGGGFSHHLRHMTGLPIPPWAWKGFTPVLLLLPLLCGLGWLGLAAFWLLICARYSSGPERLATAILFSLLLLLPPAIGLHTSLLGTVSGGGAGPLIRVLDGVVDGAVKEELLKRHLSDPQDTDLLQALALLEKRRGNFPEAERYLFAWIRLNPRSAAAFNNLGNIYLATGRLEQATQAYEKAVHLAPSQAAPHFNLGQVHLRKMLLNEAEAHFRRAREIRPELISWQTQTATSHPNRLVIDQGISPLRLWDRILRQPEGELARAYWGLLLDRFPWPYGEVPGIVLLFLLFLAHLAAQRGMAIRRCGRCGRLLCPRCPPYMILGEQCPPCRKAWSGRPASDARERWEKRAAGIRHQIRQTFLCRWWSRLLPGSGHILRGRPLEGVVYLFLSIVLLIRMFGWRGWPPDRLAEDRLLWAAPPAVLFLLLSWFVQSRLKSNPPGEEARVRPA